MEKTTELGQSGDGQSHEHRTTLTDERRRFVLNDLLSHIHPVPVYDLTDRMLAWGAAEGIETIETARFEELRRSLAEDHLPRLERAGLVEAVDEERYTLTHSGLELEASERDVDPSAVTTEPGSRPVE